MRPHFILTSAGALLAGMACTLPLMANAESVPLKEAKLIIEHNATDLDTGFQGALDSEGWAALTVTGPNGAVLTLTPQGDLATLGLTELFFETVEPENAEVPIADMLARLPEGDYEFAGPIPESQGGGTTAGTARFTHVIPAGAVLVAPAADAVLPPGDVAVRWEAVTETITGAPVDIIAYQVIVEKDGDPHPTMVGKPASLSMYLRPSVTEIAIPAAFFEPGTPYLWEVLAIESGGNQTLASSAFSTQ